MVARTIVKICQAFLASLKNYCISPKYSRICQNTTIFLPDTVLFIQCLIVFAYKYDPNNTVFALNIITKPHKMHFSHSYKGLGKCTFFLYNALVYSLDNSAFDCDSSHGSSHFSLKKRLHFQPYTQMKV